MRIIWYDDGKKVTQKKLVEKFGRHLVNYWRNTAMDFHRSNPNETLHYQNGISIKVED